MTTTKKEGYWYWEFEPHLPKPIANVLTEEEAETINQKLLKLETTFCHKSSYKGRSHSRITNEELGSEEFLTKDNQWVFPIDFRTHYVLKHRVKPSNEFLEYLNNKIK